MNNTNNNTEELLTEIGEKLKNTREKKKYSIESVSQELRIHPKFLKALESSKISDLPHISAFFFFLRSYAKFLGLNSDLIIQRCKEDPSLFSLFQGEGLIVRKNKTENQFFKEKNQIKKKQKLFLRRIFLISGFIVLVFLGFLICRELIFVDSKKIANNFCDPFEITAQEPVKIKITSKSIGLIEEFILEAGEKIKFIDSKETKVEINYPEKALIQQNNKKLKWSKYQINKSNSSRLQAYLFKCKNQK